MTHGGLLCYSDHVAIQPARKNGICVDQHSGRLAAKKISGKTCLLVARGGLRHQMYCNELCQLCAKKIHSKLSKWPK